MSEEISQGELLMYRSTSFPCLICGSELYREVEDNEAQPSDGVMCRTTGNYGSTVFDSMMGEVIRFNICDGCFTNAGANGRLFISQEAVPVALDVDGEWYGVRIGWREADRPSVPWHTDLPEIDEQLTLSPEEVRKAYDDPKYQWTVERPLLESLMGESSHGR